MATSLDNNICGVLLVDGITYGRLNGKLLYKCIPDDITLPHALVPYEDKSLAFSKVKVNKYVEIQLISAASGTLTNVFGDVDDLEAYIQYQLACKNMGSSSNSSNSIKALNAAALRALREKPISNILNNYYLIEDRLDQSIISIDPVGCQDIDDALGLRRLPDGQLLLSIYISNVPFMIDYLNLWQHISDRISTLYFSHKKVPMLPYTLSENRCSLLQGEERVAFALDVYIYAGLIKKIEINNTLIKVEKNYAYEDEELLKRSDYKDMLRVIKQLNQESFNYVGYVDEVKDSHTVVEFCMILMNHECAKFLRAKGKGIFRSATKKEAQNEDYKKVLVNAPELTFILQGVAGQYDLSENIKPHELIGKGLDCYVHITSPIRRIVDIVNMLELQIGTGITSQGALDFLQKWTTEACVDTINIKTKAIRRLQNDVELLQLYEKDKCKVYTGIVLVGGCRPPEPPTGGSGCAIISTRVEGQQSPTPVYIPELKLLTKVYSPQALKAYSIVECTVHLFLDESKMSRKVRLQLL